MKLIIIVISITLALTLKALQKKKNCAIKVNVESHDKDGNTLWIISMFDDTEFLLAVIYGPNTDSPIFVDNIFNLYEQSSFTNKQIIQILQPIIIDFFSTHSYIVDVL